jgi:uncharacterized RDD family membrane protein YckC
MYCPKCGAQVAAGVSFCPTCGGNLQSAAPPPQPPQAAPAYAAAAYATSAPVTARTWDYATWGTRAVGYIVDALLIGAGMLVLYLILGAMLASMVHLTGGREAARGFCCMMILLFPLATLLVGIYNSVYLVAQRGYSIGQGVVKVMVVDASGKLLTTGTAAIRLLVRVAFGFVPMLPALDLLWPLWDERRQTLHDKAVNSYGSNMR